ncbi:unnamed protein product [Caenorhabditis sp. 36 PRJEB53466]|nr:unnamed protein product [Caenorhabditis sp. 36 PRJEB53466]
MNARHFHTQRTAILKELEAMRTFEQNCLRGLLDCEHEFQQTSADVNYRLTFQKTLKNAMTNTLSILFVKSLMVDKFMELSELEKEQKKKREDEQLLASEEEVDN